MLKGNRTYISIAVMILSMIANRYHLVFTDDQLSDIINMTIQVVSSCSAIYFNSKRQPIPTQTISPGGTTDVSKAPEK